MLAMLDVPYFRQFNDMACGAAAFQMAYKYLRPSRHSVFSQQKMLRKRIKPAASDASRGKVDTVDIIAEARNRGLHADWGRISLDPQRRLDQLAYFIATRRIPVIACQRYTNEEPLLGHFRVLLAAAADQVVLHDPDPKTGGGALKWPMDKFVDFWRCTGRDVTGGVAIWICDAELQSPLDPDRPNYWALAGR
jgi:hypothetical protein